MSPLQIVAVVFGLLTGIVGGTIAIEARYEKAETAKAEHDLLAAENDTTRITTQLDIVKIKLDKFIELAKVRPLTESEQIELRALERERDVILERLATKG
jgi:hypothetical protein